MRRRVLLARCVALVVALCLGACRSAPSDVVRVAVVQTAGVDGDVAANAEHAAGLVRQAAAEGARFILLPELYAFFPSARRQAGKEAVQREVVESGDLLTARMVALAAELDVNIAFGKADLRDGQLYNALVFVEPTGVTGWYAKRWLMPGGPQGHREKDVFAQGPDIQTVEWGGVRVGPLICADGGAEAYWQRMRDDGARIVMWASSGFNMLSFPAGSPLARGFAGDMPVAFANRPRPQHDLTGYAGGSEIVDGAGTLLREGPIEGDAVLVADVRLRPITALD